MVISSARGQRRPVPWAALAAILALLVQGLIPAAAMAGTAGAGRMVICTATGAQLVSTGAPAAPKGGFGGLPCQHCVAASLVLVAAASPATPSPVIYAERVVHAPAAFAVGEPRARAPPRPPSQAPPTLRS